MLLLPPRRTGGSGGLKTAQPHLDPWEDNGANCPAKPFPNIRRTRKLLAILIVALRRGNVLEQPVSPL